ncbi:type IV pili methyl-accepting chemotaxis transducer N-terminal domain-containing protein [Paraburkholderia hospita]|uniref:type IV pili methyl-accepting chemotaxis transducer N-terminal domain-containing protein n=1 Tax=Paraburkholderia hospita TaxID=169430 RepID=UPI003BF9AE53
MNLNEKIRDSRSQASHHRRYAAAASASIRYTLWASWKLEGGATAVNEAGRMRMQT